MRITTAIFLSILLVPTLSVAVPCDQTTGNGTALARAAANLSSGEWCELDVGLTNSLLDHGSQHILQWADTMTWDPVNRQIKFVGHGHIETGQTFLIYDDATNVWTANNPQPWPSDLYGHANDHNTINPDNGTIYFKRGAGGTVEIKHCTHGCSSWTSDAPTGQGNSRPSQGFAWFPNLNGGAGGLVWTDGYGSVGKIFTSNSTVTRWQELGTVPSMCYYRLFAEYSPTAQAVFFGGDGISDGEPACAGNALWKIDASGNVTRVADTPLPKLGLADTLVTTEPVTGNLVVYFNPRTGASASWYEYDVSSDNWSVISGSMPPLTYEGDHLGAGAASIRTYGVIFYAQYRHAGTETYLYKHAPSEPDMVAPVSPTNLNVQ